MSRPTKGLPRISDAEWDVMTVIWSRGSVTAQDVIDLLKPNRDWNPRTVRTFLNRLVKKKALAYDVDGNRYVYRPRISRDDCIREESQSFLSRVFGGSAGAMLVQFVQQADLTPQEIEQLKNALRKRG